MPFSIRDELSPVVQQYAMYLRNVRGLSSKTVTEYCKDLRTFFRFVKRDRGLVPPETSFEEVAVQDADLEFIRSVTTYEIYAFMNYVADDRNNMASTRQRKTTTLRSFFGYLTAHEKLLEKDPTETLVAPKKGKSLPHFLSLEQSIELLNAVEGPNAERDRCILTLFLNCGMRLSELVAIDRTDVLRNNNTLRILGKGNKERIVYLNQACQEAISRYLAVRPKDGVVDRNALFLSNRGTRYQAHHRGGDGEEIPGENRPERTGVFCPQAAPHRRHLDVPLRECGHPCPPGHLGPRPTWAPRKSTPTPPAARWSRLSRPTPWPR